MKNAGTILIYNCTGPEYSKLRQIFAMLRLRMRVVEPERYHLTLAELAEGKGEEAEAQPRLADKMLVFCGLSDALLHQVLEVIRVSQVPPIDFKAVMTPTNREWTTMQLYEELKEEREAIAQQSKAHE